MFTLQNGVLCQNGKAVFALGVSYYASYHPQKFPVLPGGDRLGQMRQDIEGMGEAGFNVIRIAALGSVNRGDDGTVTVDFPLVDATVDHAGANGIAALVRLQGYIANLSGHADARMRNERDEEVGPYQNFILACLNHEGIRRDEEDACVASAAHFRAHPSVVGFQIYNEPAYPTGSFYDYNPRAIDAWRQWLVESGLRSAAEAARLEPPRRRPHYDESDADWRHWRLFHHARMSGYLNNLSDKAKEGHAEAGTMTCLTVAPLFPGAALAGVDFFRVAERMDVLGITHYIPSIGPRHYQACAVLDMAESAAALYGKHAWLLEYNAATVLAAANWERETFSAVGSGMKGIVYYQWRADYPFTDSPEPERFGLLHNDRRQTAKFAGAVALNRLVGELGARLVRAERKRSGVAVLYSEHAAIWHDARDNRGSGEPCADRITTQMLFAYREFRQAGVAVDFVRACDLARNPLGTKLLVLPATAGLADAENAQIEAFRQAGGLVCTCSLSAWAGDIGGFDVAGLPLQVDHACWHQYCLDAESVLRKAAIAPLFHVDHSQIDVKILEGCDGAGHYLVACLINIDPLETPVPPGRLLRLAGGAEAANATFFFPGCQQQLKCTRHDDWLDIVLPEITTGGFVVVAWERNKA